MVQPEAAGTLERIGTAIDEVRSWFSKAWRIGILMTKGAYLCAERRRLFGKLGEETYYRILKGEWQNAELEPLVKSLERLSKKVEIEEMLIRSVRFGPRARRKARAAETHGASSPS
jgi:hypothetical protein